jgi:tetratricopeptide (TPR) repeat protein
MIRIAARMLAAATLSLPVALPLVARAETTTTTTENRTLSSKQVYDKALHATCWVVVGQAWGTGWVLDKDKRLIVTNEHVIHGSDSAEIYFPVKENAKLVRDPDHYRQKVKVIKAKVLDRDGVRDLALLQLDSIPADVVPAKLAASSAESGEVLRAVGSLPEGSEGLWGSVSGEVRTIAPRFSARGQKIMMIETTIPINHGNSGGAVFNESGELTGVVKAAFFGGQVLGTSLLIDISEVQAYLKVALPLVQPTTAADFVVRGERRLVEERFDGAVADFSAAIERDSKSTVARIRRGVALVRKGDTKGGIADLDEALRLSPQDQDALLNRGVALRIAGKIPESIADFTKVIELNGKSVLALRERATSHQTGKDLDSALADLNKAIEIDGKDVASLVQRAFVLQEQKKFDLAIADWRGLIKLVPNNFEVHNELGIALLRKGEPGQAAQEFAQAARLNRNNPTLHSNLGVALRVAGKFAEAVKAFSDALTISPESSGTFNAVTAYFGRGMSEKELHDYPSAIKDLSKAIQLNGKVAEFWFERGLAYQANGATGAADDDFKEAVKLDPKTFIPKIAALSPKADAKQQIAENEPKRNVQKPKIAEPEPKVDGNENKIAQTRPNDNEPTPKIAPKSPLVGKWVFRGVIRGSRVEMTTQFNSDGTYDRVIKVSGCEGVERSTDSGTYRLNGQTLTLVHDKTRVQHKVRVDDESLTMNFQELGKTLVLERVN